MIDHYPACEAIEREQRKAHATAAELHELRDDLNYRYRDRQRFENVPIDPPAPLTKTPQEYAELAKEGERILSRTPEQVAAESAAALILNLILFGLFAAFVIYLL